MSANQRRLLKFTRRRIEAGVTSASQHAAVMMLSRNIFITHSGSKIPATN
jgi:hypothetical protein